MSKILSGVDLIEIERLNQINPKIRKRFIQRVFTEKEQLVCGENAACLAGRFAAKEAVSKTLGTGIGEIHWQDIEILKGNWGEPVLFLHEKALENANALGITSWSLSISHNKTTAVAFVVALID